MAARGGSKTLRSFPGQLASSCSPCQSGARGSREKYYEHRKRIRKCVGTSHSPKTYEGYRAQELARSRLAQQEAQLFLLPMLSISVVKVRSVKIVLFPLCRSVYPGQTCYTAYPPPWGRRGCQSTGECGFAPHTSGLTSRCHTVAGEHLT